EDVRGGKTQGDDGGNPEHPGKVPARHVTDVLLWAAGTPRPLPLRSEAPTCPPGPSEPSRSSGLYFGLAARARRESAAPGALFGTSHPAHFAHLTQIALTV